MPIWGGAGGDSCEKEGTEGKNSLHDRFHGADNRADRSRRIPDLTAEAGRLFPDFLKSRLMRRRNCMECSYIFSFLEKTYSGN